VSFKAGSERFLELTDRSGIAPAPYLARAHWVQVQDAKALSDSEARALVAHSYTLVAAKLPKKICAALGDASHARSAVRSTR
jgi:predicted DNA-binding protein (MmcQ/YjbR family)